MRCVVDQRLADGFCLFERLVYILGDFCLFLCLRLVAAVYGRGVVGGW